MGEMAVVPLGIKKGDFFQTYKEFDKKLKACSESKFIQFYKKESKTVASSAKKVKRFLNPSLKFYFVTWACVFGGRRHESRSKGIRNTRTLRQAELCKAHVTIRIANCGEKFIVSDVNNEHNHTVNEALFKELPHQRKLPPEFKENTKKLLHLEANKHLLMEDLEKQTNRRITLKDLSNLRAEEKNKYSNNIQIACEKIEKKFGADCHLLVNEKDVFKGLMFCTSEMKATFEAYPEFVCVDATYKLLNIRTPVYIILVEDGNGESVIVCIGILVQEDAESLTWFFENFKMENPSWTKISTFMTDKDLIERDVILDCFPGVQLQICIFHVLKIFHTEIQCDKYKISSTEKKIILEYLQQLVFSNSEQHFEKIVTLIRNSTSERLYEYLDSNWFSIKIQWCPYLAKISSNFLNTTNNRLECINSKLKQVISKNSSLEEFLEKLFTTIYCLKQEKNHRLAYILNTRSTENSYSHIEKKYQKLLSPYAFKKMMSQFDFKMIKITKVNDVFYTSKLNDTLNSYVTTINACNCYFRVSMQLPCKHIFAIRSKLNIDLFNSDLVAMRWKMEYVIQHSDLLITSTNDDSNNILNPETSIDITKKPKRILSAQEKYRILYVKTKVMASLGAEAQNCDFRKICTFFDSIILNLEQNRYDLACNSKSDILENDSIPNNDIPDNTCNNNNSNVFKSKNIPDNDILDVSCNSDILEHLYISDNDIIPDDDTPDNNNTDVLVIVPDQSCNSNILEKEYIPDSDIPDNICDNNNSIEKDYIPDNDVPDDDTLDNNNSNILVIVPDKTCSSDILEKEYIPDSDIPDNICDNNNSIEKDYIPDNDVPEDDTLDNNNSNILVIVPDKTCSSDILEKEYIPDSDIPDNICDNNNSIEKDYIPDNDVPDDDTLDNSNILVIVPDKTCKNIENLENNCTRRNVTTDASCNTNCSINENISGLVNVESKNNEDKEQQDKYLSRVVVCPAKPRGRPKGNDKTVIGLDRKKKKPIAFKKNNKNDKISTIFSWILRDIGSLNKNKISKVEEVKPIKEIDIRFTEINLLIIKPYVSQEVFLFLKNLKEDLKKHGVWFCPLCNTIIKNTDPSIMCDVCLTWIHINCISNVHLKKEYICLQCDKPNLQ